MKQLFTALTSFILIAWMGSAGVMAQCSASFTAIDTAGTVIFTNTSTGNFTVSSWDFGDGNSSFQTNPVHTYNSSGTFIVCLTISDSLSGCNDTFCDSVTVNGTGGNPCVADFSYSVNGGTVSFTNNSTGNFSSSSWTFGDGSTSSSTSPSHTFAASGTYTVCLDISNFFGCSDTYCDSVNVTVGGSTLSLGGQVTIPNSFVSLAEVFLIEQNGQILTAIDTTNVDSGGFYLFSNVPAGNYRVKAALLPASSNFASYLPTYHTSNLNWSGATTVAVGPNSVLNADITLIAGNNPGGPGFIGGNVNQGANKTAGPGDPIEGAQVMILDMNDNPVQYMYTNANGEFAFNDLALGTYKIYTEVLNKTTTPAIVTLDAANPSSNGTNILVGSAAVTVGAPVGVNELFADRFAISLFPNPMDEQGNLVISSTEDVTISLQIINSLGQTATQNSIALVSGENRIDLDASGLQSGFYFLNLLSSEGSPIGSVKFIKR